MSASVPVTVDQFQIMLMERQNSEISNLLQMKIRSFLKDMPFLQLHVLFLDRQTDRIAAGSSCKYHSTQ